MNINNKIEIHRGVYFPDPVASALNLDWEAEGSISANDLCILKRHSTNTNKTVFAGLAAYLIEVNAGTGLNTTGPIASAAAFLEFAANVKSRLFVCYQGDEEPYNAPVSGATFHKPDYKFVKLEDSFLTFEPQAADMDAVAYAAATVGSLVGIGFASADSEVGLVVLNAAGAYTECVAGTFSNAANLSNFIPIGIVTANFQNQESDSLLSIVC